MNLLVFKHKILILLIAFGMSKSSFTQEVAIVNYSTNSNGQVVLEVNSSEDNYYLLRVRHEPNGSFEHVSSMTLGSANKTVITEPLAAYPLEHYQVLQYTKSAPFDYDNDGIDDVVEFQNIPQQSPFNPAESIEKENGLVFVNSFNLFKDLSVKKDYIQWSEFLNEKQFVKYIIVDFDTAPKVYFVNTSNHQLHQDFAEEIGLDYLGDHVKKGQIIYHPTSISNNGTLGTFAFNYSNGYPEDFEIVQKTFELLAANMPFLENNLAYFITENNENQYYQDSSLFQQSRVPIVLEKDLYAEVNYWGLNQTEGFGFFHKIDSDKIPGPKDIVLYESLPNSLPRVGGIITSVIQTPLSHVNLRAIQNDIPNAFIRDPLLIDSIAGLLNDYIYFNVMQDHYVIRKASIEEVNNWFESIRPQEELIPPLNLDYNNILSLDEIEFKMYDGFGAKCANVATMRTFGFPDKTIPDGFGIPFYYYVEFMEFNNFYDEINIMINHPDFISDRNKRNELLKTFRKKIKAAEMPDWMMNELTEMHTQFPEGQSIRCRSSSNNEDLAGFNGAGLYDSKTQHPHEGHISKSIKQVYASLWNLRAFEERDFYRINHFKTSMGVLCHPNYSDEKANGVGVSIDPLYNTDNNFYLNTQVGEDLITNPSNSTIPEEILLEKEANEEIEFIVIQGSSLINSDSSIMSSQHLEEMRMYLNTIHNEFAYLYHAENKDNFAMDIEYKITSTNQLIIKQARPWVSFTLQEESNIPEDKSLELIIFPNPVSNGLFIQCKDCNIRSFKIFDILGRLKVEHHELDLDKNSLRISIDDLIPGNYIISVYNDDKVLYQSKTFVKNK